MYGGFKTFAIDRRLINHSYRRFWRKFWLPFAITYAIGCYGMRKYDNAAYNFFYFSDWEVWLCRNHMNILIWNRVEMDHLIILVNMKSQFLELSILVKSIKGIPISVLSSPWCILMMKKLLCMENLVHNYFIDWILNVHF